MFTLAIALCIKELGTVLSKAGNMVSAIAPEGINLLNATGPNPLYKLPLPPL